jgi:hypothetical protein
MRCVNLLIVLGSTLLSAACVSENLSGCEVNIAVRDKNYDNAAEAGDPVRDQNLPFVSYIGSLVTGSRPAGVGDYTYSDESLSPLEFVHPLDPSRFGRGEYEIVPTGVGVDQSDDIYLGHDIVAFPPSTSRTIWLYRANGKLVIEPENAPEGIATLTVEVDGVYAGANGGSGATVPIVYDGSTSVVKRFDIAAAGSAARFETLLAPSVDAVSPLRIVFTSVDGTSETISMNVAILRNHITVVRPRYDPPSRRWDITVLVDDKWVKVNNLDLIG